jgi:hypothetical protein
MKRLGLDTHKWRGKADAERMYELGKMCYYTYTIHKAKDSRSEDKNRTYQIWDACNRSFHNNANIYANLTPSEQLKIATANSYVMKDPELAKDQKKNPRAVLELDKSEYTMIVDDRKKTTNVVRVYHEYQKYLADLKTQKV